MSFTNKNSLSDEYTYGELLPYIKERLKRLELSFIQTEVGKNEKEYLEGACVYKKHDIFFQIIPKEDLGYKQTGLFRCSYKWHNWICGFQNIQEFEIALDKCEDFLKQHRVRFKNLKNLEALPKEIDDTEISNEMEYDERD